MAQFNPTVPDTQDPNWLNWSSPISNIEPNKSTGIALSGVGDSLKLGVEGADDYVKRDIDNKAYAAVDPARDALTRDLESYRVAQAGGGSTAVNLTPDSGTPSVPGGVQNGIDRISTLSNARDQNSGGSGANVNDTYYSANITAIAKNLRTEYPGYRDYIDQKVSQASGLPVANAYYKNLIQDINQAQAKMNGSRTKTEGMLVDAVKEGYSDANTMLNKFRAGQLPEDQAVNFYFDAASKDRADKKAREKRSDFQGTVAQDKTIATADFESELDRALDTKLNVLTVNTPFGDTRNLGKLIDDVNTGKVKMTSQQGAQFAVTMQGVRNAMYQDFVSRATSTPNGTMSYAARVGGVNNLKASIDTRLSVFDNFVDGITSDKYGIMNASKNIAASAQADKKVQMFEDGNKNVGDRLKALAVAREIGGDPFVNTFIEQGVRNDLNEDLKPYFQGKQIAAITGNKADPSKPASTLTGDIEQARSNGIGVNNELDNKFYDKLLEIPKVIGDPNAPIAAKVNAAEYAFSPKKASALRQFNMDYKDPNTGQWVQGKYGAFTRLTSPDIIKGMQEIRDKGGVEGIASYNNFIRWSELSLTETIGQDLMSVSKVPTTGVDKVHVEWATDPTKGTYQLRLLDATGKRPLPERSMDPVKQGYLNNLHDTTDRINMGLARMANIYKGEGKDVSGYLLKTIITSGFTPGPTTTGLPAAMMQAIRTANQPKIQKMEDTFSKEQK